MVVAFLFLFLLRGTGAVTLFSIVVSLTATVFSLFSKEKRSFRKQVFTTWLYTLNSIKYFIGIVPPEDIYQTVLNIQNQFGDNRLEPHITLRPPVTVIDETSWINTIEIVCSAFSPIQISLPATGNFGNRVLFIDVKSKTLASLHDSITEAIKPFEQAESKQQESRSFNPHLTLGRAWCGFTRQDFASMKILATEYLSKEPIAFEAGFVRVYHKPSSQGKYQTLVDIPLSSNPIT